MVKKDHKRRGFLGLLSRLVVHATRCDGEDLISKDVIDGVCCVCLEEERPLLYRHNGEGEQTTMIEKNEESGAELNKQ
jgi:hypothetical protein